MRKQITKTVPFSPNVEKVYYADGTVGYRGTGMAMPTPASSDPSQTAPSMQYSQQPQHQYEAPATDEEMQTIEDALERNGIGRRGPGMTEYVKTAYSNMSDLNRLPENASPEAKDISYLDDVESEQGQPDKDGLTPVQGDITESLKRLADQNQSYKLPEKHN